VLQSRTVGVAFRDADSLICNHTEWSDDATGPDLIAGFARRNYIVDLLSPLAGET
jgi:hypothetical protein